MRYRSERLHRQSVAAEGSRAVLGALQFLVAAKVLGPEAFGTFSIVVATGYVLGPMLVIGCANWIQPYIHETADTAGALSHLVLFGIGGGIASAPLAALAINHVASSGYLSVLLLCVSELSLYSVWNIGTLAFLAMGRGRAYIASIAVMGGTRVLAAGCPTLFHGNSVLIFALGLIAFGGTGCLLQSVLAGWRFRATLRATRRNFRQGLSYAAVSVATAATDQIDKIFAVGVLGARLFGVYSAAGRVSSYSLVPARGLAQVYYPKYFALVRDRRPTELSDQIKRVSVVSALSTGGCALLLVAGTWAIAHVYLRSYDGIFWIVLLLAPRLMLRPFVYAVGDALYACGQARARLVSLVIVAVSYAICLTVMPRGWGVIGVVAIGLVSEAMSLLILSVTLRRRVHALAEPASMAELA